MAETTFQRSEYPYKHNQIWHAQWPMCWTVRLMYITSDDDGPLYTVSSVDTNSIFTRSYNKVPHLFNHEAIRKLIGEEAVLRNVVEKPIDISCLPHNMIEGDCCGCLYVTCSGEIMCNECGKFFEVEPKNDQP